VKALFFGPNPPLRMLSEACDALGAGLIPVATPMLGAVLYRQAVNGHLKQAVLPVLLLLRSGPSCGVRRAAYLLH
jgi:hypothetical protein